MSRSGRGIPDGSDDWILVVYWHFPFLAQNFTEYSLWTKNREMWAICRLPVTKTSSSPRFESLRETSKTAVRPRWALFRASPDALTAPAARAITSYGHSAKERLKIWKKTRSISNVIKKGSKEITKRSCRLDISLCETKYPGPSWTIYSVASDWGIATNVRGWNNTFCSVTEYIVRRESRNGQWELLRITRS